MKKKINLRELKLRRLRFKRFTYRTGLILFGIIATAILAFNFWFIDHAEEALEQIVYTQSKGKLKLKVGRFRFNWIKNKIELQKASIISNDSTIATSYAVNTKRILIKARGFLPLLFNREILIDSIRLQSPAVVFTRNIPRVKNKAGKDTSNSNFSVAEEMGRISKSITDAINVLQIDKFRLDDGSFSLIDNTQKNETPFAVNNIYIQLDNLQFDSTQSGKKGKEKITFTDNIAIRTFDQHLVFPGGRHFIAFKDFRVNLANQRVEFDSCTVRALKGDSSRTSFRIFFDKLQLTNINFDSLYSNETIIADSVFCSRPKIFLDIDSDQKTNKKQKNTGKRKVGVERVDAVIQQLLGDMVLNYVGVKNAEIDVSTIKKAKASTFSSRNNNFEIYGLAVRQNEERPVHLDKFIMTLHNFENVLNDGRYRIAFDSIGFEDDVINLNKFSFKEYDRGRTVKILAMPSFRVRGLSWESLLYDNIFSARSAEFFSPVVDYTTNGKKKKKRSKNLFETLNNIDDVMDLKNLLIHEGDIVFRFSNGASLSLFNTNLDLRANDLTSANKIKSVQRSVNVLNFDKGVFKKDDLIAHLNKVELSENKSGLKAANMSLRSNDIKANASNIHLGDIVLDSTRQSLIVNGVSWNRANIILDKTNETRQHKTAKPRKAKTLLLLRNIKGNHTDIDLTIKQNKLTGYFNSILVNEFANNAAGKPDIKGLSLDGRDLFFSGPDMRASVAEMDITDKNNSVLKNIHFEKINQIDSIIAAVPRLTIIPNIAEIVAGSLTLQGIVLTDPVVTARLGKKEKTAQDAKKKGTAINIGAALFERPDIKLTLINKNDSASYINWDGVQLNSYLKVTNLASVPEIPVKADQVKMFLTNFEFISSKGKRTATNDNKLNLEFNDVLVKKNDQGKLDWQTSMNILSLDKMAFDSLGKNNSVLELDKGDVRNIALSSKYIQSPVDILINSNKLHINGTNGKFATGKNTLQWYGFTVKDRVLGMDSLSLEPKQPVEAYRIAKAFNEDYLKIHTGKITGGPIDLEKYSHDSILSIGSIELNDVNLFTFKDKTQPDTVIKYKPLPAEMLRKLKGSLDIDSVRIHNMHVTYWEINPNTDTLGVIPVDNLNVLMTHIKNYDIKPEDSIYILATADVLGSLHTTLDVAQSYADTTGYMRMNLTTGPMDLTKFNTVLVPLVGAKVFDGRLKSLSVNAIGNNDAAIGTAYMNYRGLNVGLLNKNDLPNQTFINRLVSRLAMIFIVRKNNRGKESLVFFERWQEKSAINYIIKTTLEGIKSSIGLPGAKKKLRRYHKKIIRQPEKQSL
ncbi:AsmA family protein [Niabella aquatica]